MEYLDYNNKHKEYDIVKAHFPNSVCTPVAMYNISKIYRDEKDENTINAISYYSHKTYSNKWDVLTGGRNLYIRDIDDDLNKGINYK